jgi:SAM-dependent methyltransferase
MSLPDTYSPPISASVPGSPYQLKSDPYSSHSLILSALGEGRGRRVLDVGAAHGYLSELLTARGFHVTGIEGDPLLAEIARTKCASLHLADLDLPLPPLDGPFDAILYGDVLEHLKNPLRILKSLNENLKPGGLAIVSVPNVAHLWIRIQLLAGNFQYTDRGILDRTHLRFFTLSSFRSFLRDADLDILRLLATPVPLPLLVPTRFQGRLFRALHALNAAAARSWKSLLAFQFVAVAQKRGSR